MQPTIALRDAIVATIVLSPAFINGLSLPWNFHNALADRAPVLSGDVNHASVNEVRTNADAAVNAHNNEERASSSHDDDEDSDSDAEFDFPTATGQGGSFPTGFGGGGASGFPTGGFGGSGFPTGCGSGALPTGTGSPFGFGSRKAAKKGKQGGMPTIAPTGCGGFGAGPTGKPSPTGGFGSGFSKN